MCGRDHCDELRDVLNSGGADLPKRKNHRLPTDTYASRDCQVLFTICAKDRESPFVDTRLAQGIINALLYYRAEGLMDLLCYCLMPDHLHFISGCPESDLEPFNAGGRGIVPRSLLDEVAAFKRYTTTQVWWKSGGEGELWQSGSYDRVLHPDGQPESAVLYVLNNPVRRGLVECWQDYPYSGIVDGML